MEDFQSDNDYYLAELHWLLYRFEGNVDDLTSAMECGVTSTCFNKVFRLKQIAEECYGHPDVPKATKAKLRRLVRESTWAGIIPDR